MSTWVRRRGSARRHSSSVQGTTGLPEQQGPGSWSQIQGHISIVVPAFNEERRIEKTVRAIFDYIVINHGLCEFIVVDDGSIDGTCEIVGRLQREGLSIKLLRNGRNRGKGYAVRHGVAASTGDMVLVTDADLATPIEEMAKLVEGIRGGADIAIGSRGLRASQLIVRQPFYRELPGRLFNLLVRGAILPGIRDTQCGFKLFRGPLARKLFARATIDGFAFDIEVLGLAVRASCKLAEVPVRWSHITQSKLRLGPDGMAMFRDMIKVAFRLRNGSYDLAAILSPSGGAEPAVVSDKT